MPEPGLNTRLPGGLWYQETLLRDAWFRTITGALEQRWCDTALSKQTAPCIITELLDSALDEISGVTADHFTSADLCVGDRTYLMIHLLRLIAGDTIWLTPHCPACESWFDIALDRSRIPVKPAGRGFPFTDITHEGRTVTLRAPNGADQAEIVDLAEEAAVLMLLNRCIVSVSGGESISHVVKALTPNDVEKMEAALEALSPEVTDSLETACPTCGHQQTISFVPYGCDPVSDADLHQDVHTIASTYHWSEQEILSLPTDRRKRYLTLIDTSRGMVS